MTNKVNLAIQLGKALLWLGKGRFADARHRLAIVQSQVMSLPSKEDRKPKMTADERQQVESDLATLLRAVAQCERELKEDDGEAMPDPVVHIPQLPAVPSMDNMNSVISAAIVAFARNDISGARYRVASAIAMLDKLIAQRKNPAGTQETAHVDALGGG